MKTPRKFYSDKIALNRNFIIPLKRDNQLINYRELENNTFKTGSSFFVFNKRAVWFRKTKTRNKETIYLFLDEKLRVKEEQYYLLTY